jgi:tetratricopeptide (TPR) repeat protein
MRGTKDKGAYDTFVKAVIGFPPTARDGKSAKQVFADSYELLGQLADPAKEPPFPRALAWKAYALALSVYEGWPLPPMAAEAPLKPEDKLDVAKKLAAQAIGLDDTDYDLHWAMADVHLIRREFSDAIKEFGIALDLNRDERHPSLFAEAAAAMMQAGDLDNAQRYFRKAARGPDWHHWMKGILLFIKSGRAGAERETFLNLALDELKGTRTQLGDDFYQLEIQLVLAAVHWRKWELLSAKASAMPPGDARDLIERDAARNLTAAERAIHAFRATFNHWSFNQAITALSLNEAADATYWYDTMTEVWKL